MRLNALALLAMVKAVVRAVLFYGVPVWAPPKGGGFSVMDEIVVAPLASALGIPKQAGTMAVMVEVALPPSDIFWELHLPDCSEANGERKGNKSCSETDEAEKRVVCEKVCRAVHTGWKA